jgi:large subunit ribosomal protein L9
MPAAMEVILLERVSSLGNLGDTVRVKPGYARNYLLPQNKALRATEENIAYFNSQKKEIEKRNETNKKEADKRAKALKGLSVTLVRHAAEGGQLYGHAAEGGQLYGSVTARDIAEAISSQAKESITRGMVEMNQSFKLIGIFTVPVALHPEVIVDVSINIARSEDEAKIQAKTGKALIVDDNEDAAEVIAKAEIELEQVSEASKKTLMEDEALEIEKEKAEAQAQKDKEEELKRAAKEEKEAAKKAKEEAEAEAALEEAQNEELDTSEDTSSEETEESEEEK